MSKVKHAPGCLATLAAGLLAGNDIAAGSAEWDWLRTGLLRYVRAGGDLTLDKALGLSACGSRHVSTQIAYRIRNHHLVEAVKHISIDPEITGWERCTRLAPHIKRLVPVWIAHHRHGQLDMSWEPWKAELFKAWREDVGMPTTARGLYSVMENDTSSLHGEHLKMLESIRGKSKS